MTLDRCSHLIEGYLASLQADFEAVTTDSGCAVITPFERPDGEHIELAVEIGSNETARLTDSGDTIGYLYVNGLSVTRSVLDEIGHIARRYGVSVETNELVSPLGPDIDVGRATHQMLQAVLATTALVNKRRAASPRLRFEDEVEALLIARGSVYDLNYEASGFTKRHKVQFRVDSGGNMLVQPLSPTTEASAFAWAERWAYRFSDIQRHDSKWRCYAVLDDRGQRHTVWSDRAVAPLSDAAEAVYWSQHDKLAEAIG